MLRLGTFASDVRSTLLTGLSTATNTAVAATDTVLIALGKLQAQIAPATLTTLGTIKANITLIQRTTAPVSVTLPAINVLGTSLLSSVSATVTGVQIGDFVTASFAAAPPANLTITAVQVTAANTVSVMFAATGVLTLGAGAQNLSFCWMR